MNLKNKNKNKNKSKSKNKSKNSIKQKNTDMDSHKFSARRFIENKNDTDDYRSRCIVKKEKKEKIMQK